ncbi:MAG: 39S ribosomal protein L24, mitochondrial [Pleopsidium flavum]|nr:MAG: 39S ribosomal protein L24, mitochondrial [Pleopsidium flavum]
MSTRYPSLTSLRAFSSASTACTRLTKARYAEKHPVIPAYPYPPSQWYKQSNRGLYGGARLQFGNTVSERTEIKNRRRWIPNIRSKRLWSDALQRFLKLKILCRVLKTIDKVGGLDEYLLGEKEARIRELGVEGWKLRWRVMQTETVQERFREERRRLGLKEEDDGEVVVASDGRPVSKEKLREEIKVYDQELDKNERDAALDIEDVGDGLGKGFMQEEAAPERPHIAP